MNYYVYGCSRVMLGHKNVTSSETVYIEITAFTMHAKFIDVNIHHTVTY